MSVTARDLSKVQRPAMAGVAWPSVMLFFGLVSVAVINIALAMSGFVPLWVGGLVNFVVLYLSAHINHEATHKNLSGTVARAHWLNEGIGQFGSFWLFLPFPAFRAVHLTHHRVTNDPALDCDMWFAVKHPLSVLLRCCSLLVGYEMTLHRLVRRGIVPKSVIWETMAQRLGWLALAVALTALGFGTEVLVLWVLPALAVMPVLAFLFAYVVHHPHSDQGKLQASNIWLTRQKRLQPLLTGIFLFQNYHLVHHLYPRVPFYRYGEVYREQQEKLKSQDAAIKPI